jgi:hypothetical protein
MALGVLITGLWGLILVGHAIYIFAIADYSPYLPKILRRNPLKDLNPSHQYAKLQSRLIYGGAPMPLTP